VPQIADQLVSLVVPLVKALKVGQPQDNADITPVISDSSATFIEGLVQDAKQKGRAVRVHRIWSRCASASAEASSLLQGRMQARAKAGTATTGARQLIGCLAVSEGLACVKL